MYGQKLKAARDPEETDAFEGRWLLAVDPQKSGSERIGLLDVKGLTLLSSYTAVERPAARRAPYLHHPDYEHPGQGYSDDQRDPLHAREATRVLAVT